MSDLMVWNVNARGVDDAGTPLVAIAGSEKMLATERVALVEAAPEMLRLLVETYDVFADDLSDHAGPDGGACDCGQCSWQEAVRSVIAKAGGK